MRTRWFVLVIGLSLALNVFLGAALLKVRHARPQAAPAVAVPVSSCCPEERALREQLERQLCAEPPDCAAIEAIFVRLDAVRAKERQVALDQWMTVGRRASCQNNRMSPDVERLLCPWRYDPREGCAAANEPRSKPRSPPT
jgi:hypothetical protein